MRPAQYVLILRQTHNSDKRYRIRAEVKAMGAKALETLYSVEEAAKKLGGVSKFTIYAWMSRGLLERTRVGGRVMVRESSLLKLLERGEQQDCKHPGDGGDHDN
jgi:excisionase family DNA binding protein